MRDHINISGVSGSIIAAGQNSRASGVVGAAPDASAVRVELDKLVEELRVSDQPEALRHAQNLREAVDEQEPQAAGRSWSKLQAALGGLTVAANLAQIGQFIQGFVS